MVNWRGPTASRRPVPPSSVIVYIDASATRARIADGHEYPLLAVCQNCQTVIERQQPLQSERSIAKIARALRVEKARP